MVLFFDIVPFTIRDSPQSTLVTIGWFDRKVWQPKVYLRFHAKSPFGHFGRGVWVAKFFWFPKTVCNPNTSYHKDVALEIQGPTLPLSREAVGHFEQYADWSRLFSPLLGVPLASRASLLSILVELPTKTAWTDELNWCCTTRDKVRFSGTCPNIKQNWVDSWRWWSTWPQRLGWFWQALRRRASGGRYRGGGWCLANGHSESFADGNPKLETEHSLNMYFQNMF